VRTDRRRLLQLRWLSIAVMTLLAGVGFPLLAPGQALGPLFAIALLLTASNLALHADTLRALNGGRGAFIQLAFDLCAWGVFLYFCGGVTNPATAMLLPLVAAGAAILPAARAWVLAGLAVALYSLLWHYHLPVALADEELAMYWHLAGMWLGFAVSAATVVWFVARLNRALARQQGALAAAQAARARDAYVVGLGKLAAGAAHRLGTPLGTLRILADDIARRPGLDAETVDDLALMASQIEHCRRS
jgi:two-component system sensor histidine kinase RegB